MMTQAQARTHRASTAFRIGRGKSTARRAFDGFGSAAGPAGPILRGWLFCATAGVPPDRDVAAFDDRAPSYEQGWRGRLHHDIADRVAELVVSVQATPRRVLDVGCGTGYLLRLLAGQCPQVTELAGIDPAPSMISAAERAAGDRRLRFTVGAAERLPYPDGAFDVVVSTTSFDHWADQRAGLGECARVLAPGGHLVLADLFSPLLVPTLLAGRRGKARTRRRASQLLNAAGFKDLAWHDTHAIIIKAVTATTLTHLV
jgi:ubiquinone/menaquinone biosynthesis C-methylase UbiE